MVKKKMITFEASEELKEALRLAAFTEKKSVSALIRKILEEQLKGEPEEGGQKIDDRRIKR